MNWGKGLMLIMALFMIFILQFVWRMQHQNIDLVSEEYYAQELGYETQMQQERNTHKYGVTLHFERGLDSLRIILKSDSVIEKADAFFYNTSAQAHDFNYTQLKLKNNTFLVPLEKLSIGSYTLKLSCVIENDTCYLEKRLPKQ